MRIAMGMPTLAKMQAALEQAPQLTRQRMLAAMTAGTLLLQREAQEEWPVGVFNSRQQLTSDAFSTPTGVLGVVGSPSPYAPVIEEGRRPGHGVSQQGRQAIALWAEKKLGVPAERALGVAFLVARRIKREGLPAKRPLGRALDRESGQIVRLFERAVDQLAADLARGAA